MYIEVFRYIGFALPPPPFHHFNAENEPEEKPAKEEGVEQDEEVGRLFKLIFITAVDG